LVIGDSLGLRGFLGKRKTAPSGAVLVCVLVCILVCMEHIFAYQEGFWNNFENRKKKTQNPRYTLFY